MFQTCRIDGFRFALLGSVVTAASVAVQAAAQPVDLRFDLPAGTTYAVKSSESMQMQVQMKDQWGNAQQMNQNFESPTNYRVEVQQGSAGVGDPRPARVRFTFDPGLTMTMGDGQNAPQRQPLPYAGKAFDAVRQNGQVMINPVGGGQGQGGFGGGQGQGQGQFGGGEFGGGQQPGGFGGGQGQGQGQWGGGGGDFNGNAAGGMDPQTQQTLQNLASFNGATLLPGRPVAVGDIWNPDTSEIMKAAQMAPGGSLKMTARLVGMGQAAGRPAAVLDLEMVWDGTSQGLIMKGPQRGKASIDLATGLLLDFELRGQLQVTAAPEMGVQMSGTATVVSTRTVRNVQTPTAAPPLPPQGNVFGDGAFGGGEVADVREEDSAGGAEVVSIREEDLGGGGGAINVGTPTFAGTYIGDKLSITLIEGDPRTIEIRRGDTVTKGFLTGNREINQSVGADGVETTVTFQGYFEFNGHAFQYSAVQPAPGVMKFTTGKTTHDLRLKAADPAAPNPFE